MPTTQDEASRIVSITQEYLPIEKMQELYTRLNVEIGKKTDNDSLKQSLAMMDQLVSSVVSNKPINSTWLWLWLIFYLLVFLHGFLVVGMTFSFVALPFLADWYIAIPLCTFIWFFSTSRMVDCKLTEAENYMRVLLGKKRIGGFVGNYFIRPIKKLYLSGK